ncbi:MAG: GTP-binding protein [Planctomycetota bacterium]
MTKTKALILNGFLGSGKTTLLRSLIIQASKRHLPIGVVVNDMSELDVDGLLVVQSELVEPSDSNFNPIYSCILSSKKGISELGQALDSMMSTTPPELILIETSGSCHPMPLVEFFRSQPQFELAGILTLVDSAMIDQDYECGSQLVPIMQHNVQNQQRDTTNLLVEQIMFCSHLLLTKVDRINDEKLQTIAKFIHELNPYVSIVSVPWGQFPIDDVLDMPAYNYDRVALLVEEVKPDLESEGHDDRPYDLATRVITDDRPFHPRRLWDTCRHQLGQHIYRSKGFFYLASRDKLSLLWNQAAGGIDLELVGHWRIGILEDEDNGLDDVELEGLRQRLATETGRFGDRRCHLTVIGDKSQIDRFTDLLNQCFLTSDEIDHWQSGGTFDDPWPTELVQKSY